MTPFSFTFEVRHFGAESKWPNKTVQATPTNAAVSRCAVTPTACAAVAPLRSVILLLRGA